MHTCRQNNIYCSLCAYVCTDAAKISLGTFPSHSTRAAFTVPFFACISFPFLSFSYSLGKSQRRARTIVLLACLFPGRISIFLIFFAKVQLFLILFLLLFLLCQPAVTAAMNGSEPRESRRKWATPGPELDTASPGCSGLRLVPNACRRGCQIECLKECKKDCNIDARTNARIDPELMPDSKPNRIRK